MTQRRDSEPNILGQSPAIQAALREARLVAPTSASVVLQGESGTGKELFARYVHHYSGREGAFIALNCAALPEAILESMLFGHRRGAFTGASENSEGLILSANGGTLFLDEVGELPLVVQAKLLRVLQERRVLRVGDTRERSVDLRVVAASHRDLAALVRQGRFREDLYFRLCRFELALPPLRERGRDVVLIARQLLRGRSLDGVGRKRLVRSAEPVLLSYGWPGNVRELENVLFRAALKASGMSIGAKELCQALPALEASRHVPVSERALEYLRQNEEASISELEEALAVPRSTLKRLLKGLCEAGDLESSGKGRSTRYRVPGGHEQAGLEEREQVALRLAQLEGQVTRKRLAGEAGLAIRTAGRVLAGLVSAGFLQQQGQGRGVRYVLAA